MCDVTMCDAEPLDATKVVTGVSVVSFINPSEKGEGSVVVGIMQCGSLRTSCRYSSHPQFPSLLSTSLLD